MPVKKSSKTSTKKSTAKPKVKMIAFEFASPGNVPEQRKAADGTKISDLISEDKSYVVRVNQQSVGFNYVIKDGDVIRVGVNTKNN